MTAQRRYFLEIENADGSYQGRLHRGDPGTAIPLEDLALAPDATVRLHGQDHTLAALVRQLAAFDTKFLAKVLNERGQLELGHHLYRETFGRLDASRQPAAEDAVRLEVVTADEHAARLPWVLLARRGVFLCATGWSVALCRERGTDDCELPPSPRILVAVPEPQGVPPTEGRQHLAELEDLLGAADVQLVRGGRLDVVRSWNDFHRLAAERRPDVVYYYGHGEGDLATSRLLFEDDGGRLLEVPVADVAHALRRGDGSEPLLAYVNCCQGDAGGVLGAGWQLGEVVPAVVTNRTVAYVDAARKQALELWRATLLEGVAPHAAVADLYGRLGNMGLSFRDVRWMTPVFHGSYATWRSNPPQPAERTVHDAHWEVKLDRVAQFSRVAFETRHMLRDRRPLTRAYVWYGHEGQGIDHFHDRIRYELRQELEETYLYRVTPVWPDELTDPHRSFTDMVKRAFDVASLDALPGRIRTRTRGETGRRVLVFLRHETLGPGDVVKPSTLRRYIEWWDHVVTPYLDDARGFALLGISFVVSKPERFQGMIDAKLRGTDAPRTGIQVLDELQPVTRHDVEEFLREHEIRLPAKRKERVLEDLFEETGGVYEPTVEALKGLAHRAWDLSEDQTAPETFDDENDF